MRRCFNLVAPAGTPASIVRNMNADVQRIFSDPTFQKSTPEPSSSRSSGLLTRSQLRQDRAAEMKQDHTLSAVTIRRGGPRFLVRK